MYKTTDLKENPRHLENRIRTYWHKHNLAQKSVDIREGNPRFIFYEGPPTANGKPGIHHIMARTLKDAICRYKTMNGFQVKRKAGWDTHGLPVEIEVEKELGLKDKRGIEDYGIEKFCQKCRDSVFSYEKLWREMTELMGYWIDLDHPYVTLHNSYIESVWWILNNFFSRGLIYKAYKIVPYCPSCGTPLSSHEVAQGYQDIEDPSVYVKFKALDEENTYFLAWTTTPWTLISNVALAVHPDETYVKVHYQGQNLILAKARLQVLDEDVEIISEMQGSELEGRCYQPLFNFIPVDKPAWYICLGNYVTMSDGTGIVHTAPAFGQDDYSLAVKYNLPFIQPVDGEGKFTEAVTPWAHQFVKDADKDIIRHLKESGNLLKREQIKHSYPFCWRCKSPLIYYARESWYIRTTAFKEQLLENNRKIDWYPAFVGEKRFGDWLENNVDWALSRDRFWGTPLNIWICEKCGKQRSLGSIEELRQEGKMVSGKEVPEDLDLHRPYIDEVVLTCSCGSKMQRTPEVIDCWFDSGSMPFAQWHYPFENEEHFEPDLFPADIISEGIDQTRGWFYSMLAISTMLKGVSSYKSCLVNDMILDKNGRKMSKSHGNAVDPIELMQNYGADAIRWYLLEVSPPWVPTRFDVDGVKEILGKFIGTLKNVYSFFATYANIDGFNATDYPYNWVREIEIDRWIVSRLQSLIITVRNNTDVYDFTKAVRAIQSFVIEELSNWYVRRSRRRFWASEFNADKTDAYRTLYQVLLETAKLIAPFAPYLAEELFLNLNAGESVHLEYYPVADNAYIDTKLEKKMQTVIDIVSLGRAARNECQIKVRQPLTEMFVPAKVKDDLKDMIDLVKEEVNIRKITFVSEQDGFVQYELKPDFKILGPKYGKKVQVINTLLNNTPAANILLAFNSTGSYPLNIEGETINLLPEEVSISIIPREGYVFANTKDLFVALDTKLTDELVNEGYARELINKIQFTRKEMNLDIMDNIIVTLAAPEDIVQAVQIHRNYILTETLGKELILLDKPTANMLCLDINGSKIHLGIEKVVS
ncbi:MAG TPA: isoleucine--tRNA ligase [Candidatus Cloacimonas sp.]|nr:isoleucine--tRNA ligase [Candidatus Cloacimonas sp.]HPS60995.1 isoleucine--tRNA ligase [Candidatus Cloacimonas sp.]